MAGRLVASVRDLVSADSNEFVRVRAGGVAIDGKALILPSSPEQHLPALVATLVRSGAGYLGDEIVNIDPVLHEVHSLSLPLLLDRSDVVHFPMLGPQAVRASTRRDPAQLGAKGPRFPVLLEEIGGFASPPVPLGEVVFPSFQPGRPTAIREIGPSEALFRLADAMLNLHIWTKRAITLFRELLETVRVAVLVVGSLHEADVMLREWMAEPARVRGA